MSERAARRLLANSRGKTLCVRFHADGAGNVVHAPRSSGPAAAGAVLSVTLASGCAGHGADDLFEIPSEGVCTDVDGSIMECEREEDDLEPPFVEDVPLVRTDPPPVEDDGDGEFREEDDGYWFDEDPIVDEPLSERAPAESCEPISVSRTTMGAMVVVDTVHIRERNTQSYLQARTDRVRAWLAERREARRARRAARKAARSKLTSR